MFKFLARKTRTIGPLRITVNQSGKVSWGIRVWRYSWSRSTGKHSFNSPGVGRIEWGGRSARRSPGSAPRRNGRSAA